MTATAATIQGLDAAINLVGSLSERRANYALATALTRTALVVRDAERDALDNLLDRPTPYTRRSLWVQTATGSRETARGGLLRVDGQVNSREIRSRYLQAAVGIKDDAGGSGTPAVKYLAPLIDGVPRHIKRFERALQASGAMPAGWQSVPAVGARLDGYGNISRGQIAQILSQVGTELTAGYSRTISRDPRRRIAAQRRAGGQYFAVVPGQRQRSRLKPGVYIRELIGHNITPVLLYVPATRYRRIWDFHGIAAAVADRELPRQVDRAVAEHIARARVAAGGQA